MNQPVAVLMGGHASEHDISLLTGKAMCRALMEAGREVIPVVIGEDKTWNLLPGGQPDGLPERVPGQLPASRFSGCALETTAKLKGLGVQVVVLALHGRGGEDGTIQGFLETAGFAHTGSSTGASALAIDKIAFKRLVHSANLPTAQFDLIRRCEVRTEACLLASVRRVLERLGTHVVVKAPALGSSEHIHMTRTEEEAASAVRSVLEHEDRALVETTIIGQEFTVPVIGTRDSARAMHVIEIKPRLSTWFDRSSKYQEGGALEVVPAKIPRTLARELQSAALRCHQVIGASGVTRTDFIVDRSGNIIILEINTLPGMTEASLVPKAAIAAGTTMAHMMEELVQEALEARKPQQPFRLGRETPFTVAAT